jgi:hypothetical protein
MIEFFYNILHWMALHPFWAFLILLVEFIVIMKIHHKAHNPVLHKVLGVIFTPQNVVVNATAITIIGVELPRWQDKEFTTTARMKRWKEQDPTKGTVESWRFNFATKLCDLLNKYDSGHC